jgi:folate-binding protein YgfZ
MEQSQQWLPATHDTLLEVVGPDALKFLQGQTSANFANAQPMDVRQGAFCDIKGRVLCDFLALVVSVERVLLRISGDLAPVMQEHLKKYLMFAKADLISSQLTPFGALPKATPKAMPQDAEAAPENTAIENNKERLSMPFAGAGQAIEGGFSIPMEQGAAEVFIAPNADHGFNSEQEEASADTWQTLNILLGLARVRAATSGNYLPQDLNFDLNGFIDFKKGCYTGQEIIARLHWRGTPKRRLYLAGSDSPAPAPGTPLTTNIEGKVLGSVVNAASWPCDRLRDWIDLRGIWTTPELAHCRALLLIETTEDGLSRGLRYDGSSADLVTISTQP